MKNKTQDAYLEIEDHFDEGKSRIEDKGYGLMSLEDMARLGKIPKLNDDKRVGSWVSNGVIYFVDKKGNVGRAKMAVGKAIEALKKAEKAKRYENLTPREREVLALIAKGMSNKEIARQLFISDKTVKNHLSNIFEKLHINDRTSAAVLAVKEGLVYSEGLT